MTHSPALFKATSPFEEMLAFESLMSRTDQTFSKVAKELGNEDVLPSKLVLINSPPDLLRAEIASFLKSKTGFTVCHRHSYHYPLRLKDTDVPIPVFYAKGDLGLLESKSISVVGTREASEEGQRRAAKLVKGLVQNGFTIVSGLAKGIDTVALTEAIAANGRVIGVIGTPIDEYYPKENKELQNQISDGHLLISQVPFFRYKKEPFKFKRFYFPLRNETMAALSQATIIVEASDTSGTLIQAKACIAQGRKLFILDSCFRNPSLKWPHRFLKQGAIRVTDFDQIFETLASPTKQP
jgi:DNA processing protein